MANEYEANFKMWLDSYKNHGIYKGYQWKWERIDAGKKERIERESKRNSNYLSSVLRYYAVYGVQR